MSLPADYNRSDQLQKIYHGVITPSDVSRSLFAAFNRGNYRAQQIGTGERIVVQIGTRPNAASGGQTAIIVSIQSHEDGILVQMGRQNWLGLAASLGKTALFALRNPLSLLHRIDDLAQDIESIQLIDQIWRVIDQTAQSLNSTQELSERFRRLVCEYCNTANPVGEPRCIACGAPLGNLQPKTCRYCGFILKSNERKCPNCGKSN
ncbi:zinc ribbon domain-containing protein [Bellilinea sp.]|uniref:zinc ribbon domain-containing protein n=1 Tax=Bellilinea sp. TaxID=2838785 RepID=UPI002ADD3C1C|nr:zinc ribbon domain-containing protein [Bellilinea sp.]